MNNVLTRPYLIFCNKFGKESEGFISVATEEENIPFKIKRVFWTYGTPDNVIRGKHAHHMASMVIFAVIGHIKIKCIDKWGELNFLLDSPNQGLYIPAYCWHTMSYGENSVQVVLTDTKYDEADYIRDFEEFNKLMDT
ncbi:MAG: FdtA/QdtA family cupin domain-containing protein [Saprospiraceae bacterium]|nr:FdtA/QdtA family cupin domain-containing protein [Saprospiraceae bacterium]